MPQAARSEIAAANGADDGARAQRRFWGLTLGSIGVVYGDIGTSPIYAFREALHAASLDGSLSRTDVLDLLQGLADKGYIKG